MPAQAPRHVAHAFLWKGNKWGEADVSVLDFRAEDDERGPAPASAFGSA